MMRRVLFALSVVGFVFAGVNTSWAAVVVHYDGAHPVHPQTHRGMCYIDGPHVHSYEPHQPLLYVQVKGSWSFIGDPVEFERTAPKYLYHSHHPVFWVAEDDDPSPAGHYCYITGPHHHWYAPPPEAKFELKGGVYWYVGGHPTWYRARWRRHRHLDAHYAAVHIDRPVITVEPPSGFVGVVVGPGGAALGVGIAAPHVGVDVHLPGVGVVFGGGHPHHDVHVVDSPHHVRYKVKHRGGPPPHAPAWGVRGGHPRRGKGKRK